MNDIEKFLQDDGESYPYYSAPLEIPFYPYVDLNRTKQTPTELDDAVDVIWALKQGNYKKVWQSPLTPYQVYLVIYDYQKNRDRYGPILPYSFLTELLNNKSVVSNIDSLARVWHYSITRDLVPITDQTWSYNQGNFRRPGDFTQFMQAHLIVQASQNRVAHDFIYWTYAEYKKITRIFANPRPEGGPLLGIFPAKDVFAAYKEFTKLAYELGPAHVWFDEHYPDLKDMPWEWVEELFEPTDRDLDYWWENELKTRSQDYTPF